MSAGPTLYHRATEGGGLIAVRPGSQSGRIFAQHPATVLKKIAETLNTTVDFLMNGNASDKSNGTLQDAEVIRYFKKVGALPVEDKSALLRVIAGLIWDVNTKQAYTS
jgi:hypothetical protein